MDIQIKTMGIGPNKRQTKSLLGFDLLRSFCVCLLKRGGIFAAVLSMTGDQECLSNVFREDPTIPDEHGYLVVG